jgi:hypothetical protein
LTKTFDEIFDQRIWTKCLTKSLVQ